MVLVAQISVGPELPETYWRLPVGDIHWTPNSQSFPLLGVVASHTSTAAGPGGVPVGIVKSGIQLRSARIAG